MHAAARTAAGALYTVLLNIHRLNCHSAGHVRFAEEDHRSLLHTASTAARAHTKLYRLLTDVRRSSRENSAVGARVDLREHRSAYVWET